MRKLRRLLTLTAAAATAGALTVLTVASPALADTVTSDYIVASTTDADVPAVVDSVSGSTQEILDNVDMVAAELTPSQAAALDSIPGINVYPDVALSVADVQNTPGWALDRLDQSQPSALPSANPNHQFWYPASAGSGVRVYVLDTGVNPVSDLSGRLLPGYDATTRTENGQSDCYGHGTAVATVAAGTANGAAKLATVVPVKVADCTGSASSSNMIAGLNWIIANNPAGVPAVINISMAGQDFSSDAYNALDLAVESAVSAGFFITIAAGNFSPSLTQAADACQNFPARAASAFTMGAIDPNVVGGNEGRASFSNAGSCLDAWAPGQWVNAQNSAGSSVQVAGTSFAAPLAAGVAALYLAENPTSTPAQTTTALKASAQAGALYNSSSDPLNATVRFSAPGSTYAASSTSPNLILHLANTVPDTTTQISNVSWSSTRTSGTLTFTAPAGTTTQVVLTRSGEPARTQTTTGSSVAFTELTAGGSYLVTATTINEGLLGLSPYTTTVTTSSSGTAPSSPRNVASDSFGNVTWTAPLDNGGSTITDYQLQTSLNGSVWTSAVCSVTGTSCSLSSLASNTTYQVRVSAVNSSGNSAWSAPATFTTSQLTPGAPTGVSVSNSTTTGATLSWFAPASSGASEIVDYDIMFTYDGGTNWYHYPHTASASTSIEFNYGGRRAGWTFDVKISAINSYGAGTPAETLTYTAPSGIPDAPTAVQKTASTWSSITLSWTAPVEGANGSGPVVDYNVVYSGDNGASWSALPHSPSTATSATIAGLLASHTYLVAVSAATDFAVGPTMTTSMTTSDGTPQTPTGVKLTANASTGATLAWAAPAAPAEAPVLDYVMKYSMDGGATWNTVEHAASPATSVTVTYPTPIVSTKVIWNIAAVNKYGTSAAATYSYTSSNGTAGAPQNITVAANTVNGMKLTWTPGTSGAAPTSYYLVSYSLNGGATWSALARAAGTSFAYTYPAPRSLTTMTWKVQAVNTYGTGAGALVTFTTPPALPVPVTNLTLVTNTAVKTVLTWTAPGNSGAAPVIDYVIMRSSNGGSTWATVNDGISTATSFTASYPAKNTTYIYRVYAKTMYGQGAYAQITFTTPAK